MWFIIQRSGFLHSAGAAVGMTISKRFYGSAYSFYNVSRRPAALIRLALWGEPASPKGSFFCVSVGLR